MGIGAPRSQSDFPLNFFLTVLRKAQHIIQIPVGLIGNLTMSNLISADRKIDYLLPPSVDDWLKSTSGTMFVYSARFQPQVL